MSLGHLHGSVVTLEQLQCTSRFGTPSFPREGITNGHGGQLWPEGLKGVEGGGGGCKVASLTPRTIWGTRGRRGRGG